MIRHGQQNTFLQRRTVRERGADKRYAPLEATSPQQSGPEPPFSRGGFCADRVRRTRIDINSAATSTCVTQAVNGSHWQFSTARTRNRSWKYSVPIALNNPNLLPF